MKNPMFVELLLSCGHIKTVEIEAVIFSPKVGEKSFCDICAARNPYSEAKTIINVGVAWREISREKPTIPPEQLPLFTEDQK